MGFALTLLYIVLTIISPDQFGPEWADYHVMVYLAIITAVASAPNMLRHVNARASVQTLLVAGFVGAIALSQVANGWVGGAVISLREILPSAAVFFFIVANVTTLRRLKAAIWVTIGTCGGVAIEALCGYYRGFRGDMFVLVQYGDILRLRAAGFLSDPNDLAQILLIALSLLFVSWMRGRAIVNWLVAAPAALLLWAIYLTHSRGALIALGVLVLMASQKKLGKTASAVLAGTLVIGMMALDFTGGRGISAADGVDRLELWAEGLELFKSAPLFGIGFGGFGDAAGGLTAHNSFVLCLAELGLVGSTIFVALLVTTLIGLNKIVSSEDEVGGEAVSAGETKADEQAAAPEWEASSYEPYATTMTAVAGDVDIAVEPVEAVEADQEYVALRPFAVAMRLALIAFITTSFFLSRSYVATMYLILGLATATIALEQPAVESSERQRWGFVTLAVEASAIVFIYCVVRLRH